MSTSKHFDKIVAVVLVLGLGYWLNHRSKGEAAKEG